MSTPVATSGALERRHLRLDLALVFEMAFSSLRERLGRTVLTILTVAFSAGFVFFLLLSPQAQRPADIQGAQLLLILALLVSAAGIVNTMLMTVTRRFREIGTLKCLGALDSFVLLSVIVESALMGLAGAAAGVVGGLLGAVLVALVDPAGLAGLRWEGWVWKLGAALGVGLVLTVVGAVPPALVASRMAPVEAMRGEK